MADKRWRKPEVNEALAVLYLRLNGYFTTGLVVQSEEWGHTQAEIDCFAVRHPEHSQPDRGVPSSPFLALGGRLVDVLICEVKSLPSQLAFNESLRGDPAVLEYVLRWGGFFSKRAVSRVARQVHPLVQDRVQAARAVRGVSAGGIRVRALLCCPPASEAEVPGSWCLTGTEILRFAHECFNPAARRSTCSTRYNFHLWGSALGPIVRYFKDRSSGEEPTVEGLYEYVDAT